MEVMNLEQIRTNTMSKTASAENCVYEAVKDTTGVYSEDGTLATIKMYDLRKGDRFIVSGCGDLDHELGTSLFLINDKWVRISNAAVKHVANHIMKRYQDV